MSKTYNMNYLGGNIQHLPGGICIIDIFWATVIKFLSKLCLPVSWTASLTVYGEGVEVKKR